MIRGKFFSIEDDLQDVFAVRKKVFQEEQGIAAEIERDEIDPIAMHGAVYDENDNCVAAGRIFWDDGRYVIGRVAVLAEQRGKGYGDFLVRMLIDRANLAGAKQVFAHVQKETVGFYESIGFRVCGEEYAEAGKAHLPMVLRIDEMRRACHEMHSK